ncbi:MAG TPA: hypothetical protein PK880_13355 [Candidatus Competibacter sp.]|nr:hypothetical protein [Candidatus Competibacter sp.]
MLASKFLESEHPPARRPHPQQLSGLAPERTPALGPASPKRLEGTLESLALASEPLERMLESLVRVPGPGPGPARRMRQRPAAYPKPFSSDHRLAWPNAVPGREIP